MPELNVISFVSGGRLNKKKKKGFYNYLTFVALNKAISQVLSLFLVPGILCANKSVITSRNCRTAVFSSFSHSVHQPGQPPPKFILRFVRRSFAHVKSCMENLLSFSVSLSLSRPQSLTRLSHHARVAV